MCTGSPHNNTCIRLKRGLRWSSTAKVGLRWQSIVTFSGCWKQKAFSFLINILYAVETLPYLSWMPRQWFLPPSRHSGSSRISCRMQAIRSNASSRKYLSNVEVARLKVNGLFQKHFLGSPFTLQESHLSNSFVCSKEVWLTIYAMLWRKNICIQRMPELISRRSSDCLLT